MALTDTPVTSDSGSATGTATMSLTTTHSFSPGAGSMVLVRLSWLFNTGTATTITVADSHGNSYTSQLQAANSFQVAGSAFFYHVYSSAPGATTLTVTSSASSTATGGTEFLISPSIITGQASGTIFGPNTISTDPSGSTTALTASLTTTAAGSQVYLAGGITTGSALTANAATTTTATFNGFNNAVTGLGTAQTGTPGATTFGWTASPAAAFGGNLLGVEVLPSAGSTVTSAGSASMAGMGASGTGSSGGGAATFTAVGSIIQADAPTFSLTPGAVGDVIVFLAWTDTAATPVTALSSSNVTWVNKVQVTTGLNGYAFTAFLGTVTSTATQTVTMTGGDVSELRCAGWEFLPSGGAAGVTLDTSAVLNNTTATADWPSITPGHGAGELFVGLEFNETGATVGTTPGYVYTADAHGNGFAYNTSFGSGAGFPVWGDTDQRTVLEVLLYQAGVTVTSAGSASMAGMAASGSGTVIPPVTSAGSASLGSMAAHGSGGSSNIVTGTGSASLGAMAAAGTGSAPVIGSGSASLGSMAATGSGTETIGSSGSASMASVAASGTGAETIPSTGSASLGAMRATGSGAETIPSSGSVSLAPVSAGGTGAAPVIATGSASLASMAVHGSSGSGTVTLAGTWTGSYAVTSGFSFPSPSAQPLQVQIANTPGDWVFAIIAWRPSVTGSGVSAVVADDAHNWWEPVGAPGADSDVAGVVRTAVWAAPAGRVADTLNGVTNVQVAPTGPVLSMAVTIADMNGPLPWYEVAVITGDYASASASLSLSSAAPSARALLFAAFASDDNSKTVTGPSGWTALTGASASNGTDRTADIRLTPAWQVTDASATATVSASGTLDLAGVIAGIIVSAPQPAQPSPNWPVMITEAAIGFGAQTPPSQMTWTTLAGRSLALSIQQGKQYSLGQLQAGQGTITLDDPDGALIPPGTGAYAGIDSGTPLRRRVIWPGLPGSPNLSPNYVAFSGFISRWPFNLNADLLRGQVIATITDVWAYGPGTLNSMAVEECLLDSPHSLWPLTDPAGSTGAGNLVADGAPLPLVTSKFGAGGATATWGANSGALAGMSSAQVTSSGASGGASGMLQQQLAGTALSTTGQGFALAASDSAFPAVSDGVEVEDWAQLQLGAVQAGGTATASPMFGGTDSLPAGQAVVLAPLPGFTFPTGPTAGVIYFTLSEGTQYDLSTTPGGSPVTVTSNGNFLLTPTVPWNPVILAARGISGTVAQLEVNKLNGNLLLRYRPAAAVIDTLVTVDTASEYRQSTVLSQFTLSITQTTWRVMVNAGATLNASGTFSGPLPATFGTACYGGVMDRVSQGLGFTGFLAVCGVYPGISEQARVVSRFWATLAGMVNEAAWGRVERALEYSGMTGRRWIGAETDLLENDIVVSGQDIGGQPAVTAINNVTQSTLPAYTAVAPTGDIVYRSKAYTWNETVRWVLGDDTAAGEVPFQPGSMATDYDPSRVTASVQLTQLDTQAVTTPSGVMSAATMAAVARTAARQYGGAPYQQTGYLTNDWNERYVDGASLVDLANWVQAVYAKPANRVQAVTVDAASHPAAWPFWAGAAVGDMVAVNVRLPTAATSPLITLTARITQTSRSSQFSQDGTSATITATLDFAPEYQALTCDDPVRGLLNGQNVLPWLRSKAPSRRGSPRGSSRARPSCGGPRPVPRPVPGRPGQAPCHR